jgi:hypothetical protein
MSFDNGARLGTFEIRLARRGLRDGRETELPASVILGVTAYGKPARTTW